MSKLKQDWNKAWNDFKKDCTWDNFKMLISGVIPMILYLYCWSFWFNYLAELLNHKYNQPKTLEEAAINLCILCGMIAPICLTIWFGNLGWYIGKITGFFKDNKTRRLNIDETEYFIRDMPEDQREKIKELLSPYKSKLQLKKERLANKSWLRRTFS